LRKTETKATIVGDDKLHPYKLPTGRANELQDGGGAPRFATRTGAQRLGRKFLFESTVTH
jgi:hypothetical protein